MCVTCLSCPCHVCFVCVVCVTCFVCVSCVRHVSCVCHVCAVWVPCASDWSRSVSTRPNGPDGSQPDQTGPDRSQHTPDSTVALPCLTSWMGTLKGLIIASNDKTGPDQNDKQERFQHGQMPSFPFNQGHLVGPSARQNPEERPGQHVDSRLCALGDGQMQAQMHPACEYMALPLEQTLGLHPETFLKAPRASKPAYPRAKAPGVYCPP